MDKKRCQNWTESERLAASDLIIQNYDLLYGKFRGASSGAREKQNKWEEIAADLNSSGKTSCTRTVPEIKKMFCNQKTRAKEKKDLMNRTGGGPSVPLSCTEDFILQHLQKSNSVQVNGILGGVESTCHDVTDVDTLFVMEDEMNNSKSDGDLTVCVSEDISSFPPIIVQESSIMNSESVYQTADTGYSNVKQKKTRKRSVEQIEDQLYELEKKKILAEIKRQEMETLYFEQKISNEKKLFKLQEELLKKQLDS